MKIYKITLGFIDTTTYGKDTFPVFVAAESKKEARQLAKSEGLRIVRVED